MSNIKNFSSDETLKLQLVNGDVIESLVKSEIPDRVGLTGAEQQESFAIDQIASINFTPIESSQWQGKLFAGLNVETGNTEAQDSDLDVKVVRETKLDRAILDLRYEEDRREDAGTGDLTTSKRYYALGGHYDYFTTERFYLYGDARAEKEPTANLDQRIKLGIGAGYRWIETTKTRFEVESGLSWVSEEFTNDTEWLVSLEDADDQLFSMDTGLAYKLNNQLSLEARMHYDWDKSPAVGNDTEDFRYVFGVGWGF